MIGPLKLYIILQPFIYFHLETLSSIINPNTHSFILKYIFSLPQEMDRDLTLTNHRKPPYFTARCLSSPSSCLSLLQRETEYARISDHNKKRRSSPRLRNFLRRILFMVTSCGLENAKPKRLIKFHYDAVSYAQNFDDGFNLRDDDRKVFRSLRAQSLRQQLIIYLLSFLFC